MSRVRKPAEMIAAEGRNHMGAAELDARRDSEVRVPTAAVEPPSWLPKSLHAEFLKIGGILKDAGLYSDLDRDVLAQYFLCRERWRTADRQAAKYMSGKRCDVKEAKDWTSIQASYFKQARQAAESMGLSITSRCRLVIPQALADGHDNADDGEDEFTKALHRRQQKAVKEAGG